MTSVGGFPAALLHSAGAHVYLLYVDESGKAGGTEDNHVVVAGFAVHEDDCYPWTRSLASLQRRIAGAQFADLELHATEVWSGRSEWARVPISIRRRLMREVFRHVATWQPGSGRPARLFAVIIYKPTFTGSVMERAHEELFSRFDEFLTRLHNAGESHRSIIVADDSSYQTLVQTLVPKWKLAGTRMGRLHSLAELPLYVDSKSSRLVQAADFVAWGTWQYYENGHPEHLERVHLRFDSDGGVQHGLAHINRRHRTCACVACDSRRTQTIPDELPPRISFR